MIPWSRLPLLTSVNKELTIVRGGRHYQYALTVVQQSRAVAVQYPLKATIATPQPSPGAIASPLSLHAIGGDIAGSLSRQTSLALTVAQNDAAVAQQQALSQVLKFVPIPVPSSSPQAIIPQTLQTRSGSALPFESTSTGLVDPTLKTLFDTTPFAMQKVGTLNVGSLGTWATANTDNNFDAAAFYGIKEAGGDIEAASFNYSSAPAPVQPCNRFAARLAIPKPVASNDDAAYLPSTIALQYSSNLTTTGMNPGIDRVEALGVNQNFLSSASCDGSFYETTTAHMVATVIRDLDTKPPPGTLAPAITTQGIFAGISSARTLATVDSGLDSFQQIRLNIGAQLNDPLFGPSSGTTTYLAALSGPYAHAGYSMVNGDAIWGLDLLGYRLSNIYADFDAATSETLTLPTFRNVSLLIGTQDSSLSDRVAVLQQGQTMSYNGLLFPKSGMPAADGVIQPQTQNFAQLSGTVGVGNNGKNQLVLTIGAQEGESPSCLASTTSPVTYSCSDAVYHNGTWGIQFNTGGEINAGFSSTSANAGELAFGSSTNYFGGIGASPGTASAFFSYTDTACTLEISSAYTNAAYVQMSSIPQAGKTVSVEIDYPIPGRSGIDLSAGYLNIRSATAPQAQQHAVYILARFLAQGSQIVRHAADKDGKTATIDDSLRAASSGCPASLLIPQTQH